MTSFGSFREEDDNLKDLSIELTSHKEWLDRIKTQGNKPEEWVEFIEHIKSQITVPYESFWNRYICDLYVTALKSIPGALSKRNVMFVKLLIDYANLKSEDNADDGQMLFSQARSVARMFSVAHIAAAEFELKQGNKVKCQKILEKAEVYGAQPTNLLKEAIHNLKAGKSYLLTATQKAEYFEKKNEIEEEKPALKSSVSLPDGSTKNKFLVDIMTSQAPAMSRVKSEPHSVPEKASQPSDPFGSSEKWVSGSLLSEKWGSCGNFSSEGRLSSIFSGPDRRLSSIHNVVDRRLSSIHSVTDRRISILHSSASLSSSDKGLPSLSSTLGHHTTPDCKNPHVNSDHSGSSSTSSNSKLFNVSRQPPRRVKIDSKSLHSFDDEDDNDEDNNTVYNFKSTMTSGRSFSHKFQSDPITEEDDAIDGSKLSIKDKKSAKTDKFDSKSIIGSQINEKDDLKSCANGKASDKDDFPQLPTPPTFSTSFLKNLENRRLLSTSTSLSTSISSSSTSSCGGEKTKVSASSGDMSNPSSSGLSRSRSALDKLLSETDNLLASTNVTPRRVFAEPKPVSNFVKPSQPKCHVDTPRPSTGTSPVACEKENIVAPPLSSLNKLISDTDNMLASTRMTPHVFAEPKPVAALVKPSQPKCHPDTPRPDTGSPPVAANKENIVEPPSSRRCLHLNPFLNSIKTSSPPTCDSITSLSETLKAATITVRENINDTVLFEDKPADSIQAPSILPPTKSKTSPESSLSFSSSVDKRPDMSDMNRCDDKDKLETALFQSDSVPASTVKENKHPCVTPAKFLTKTESLRLQEKLSESIGVTPLPKLSKVKPDALSESHPSVIEKVNSHAVDKLEKAKLLVESHHAEKHQTLLQQDNISNVPPTNKELPQVDKMVISESKSQVNLEKAKREQLASVENLPDSKYNKHEPNPDRHHSVVDAKSKESAALVQKKDPLLPKNPQTCNNEASESVMDKGKLTKDPVSSKAKVLSEGGPGEKIQFEKPTSKAPQPKPEIQSKSVQEKPISQQNREENPVANSNGPVTYQMSLDQPIQTKKHRSLIVNGKTYMILKMVGRGGSSKVYRVLDQSYNMLAVKQIDFEGATEGTIQSYMNEVTLLKRLQYSDLVIKLHDFELDYTENCLYLVLECGETDLAAMFKNRTKKDKVPREMVKFYWGEMLRAVQVLHKEGIVHSDLKPANFLIVGGNLKLIDFGIAGIIQNDRTSMTRDTQMGTLNYMSPETILEMQSDTGNRLHKFKISVKSDVWSLGCILYSMIYSKTPFQHITNPTMKLQAIVNPNHHIEFGDEYDTDLLDTIKKCLRRNPKERLSIDELLQHPYLTESSKATPSKQNEADRSGDVNNLVADMQSAFNKLLNANVASPNTIQTLKQTLQQLGSKKEMNKILDQLPSSKKSSSPDVCSQPEIISKAEPKQKFANGGVKEVRAPLQCLNLKDLRREKVSKDSS